MRRLAILTTGLLVLGFASAKAKGEKTNDAKTTEAVATPTEVKAESKTQLTYYWFDANNNTYIGHSETSGCDESNATPCALGYTSVSNPSNPQKPSGAPQETETGVRP